MKSPDLFFIKKHQNMKSMDGTEELVDLGPAVSLNSAEKSV